MAKKINVLAELLKCALFDYEIDEHVKKTISENAVTIYNMALHHDLAHLVGYALVKSGIVVEDVNLADEFLKQQAMAVMRYENQRDALEKIKVLFESEKIPFVPLKGAVIRDLYPEPWMRTSCDIDVLVHEEDIEKAKKALVENLGFVCDPQHCYHDISLFLGEDVHLELHFSIKETMDNIDMLLEKVWEHARPIAEGAFEHVLSDEFLVFQHVAHMSYHFVGGGCGIRGYVDLFLLNKYLDVDREKLDKMLSDCGIKKFYDLSVRLSDVWFADAEHDDVTYLMHCYILEGGVYGKKDTSIAVRRMKKDRFSYVFGRIFLPFRQLVITYPKLGEKPALMPFYQIKRWCRIVFAGKTKRSINELKTGVNVTAEKIDYLTELFEKTGLINNSEEKRSL